MIIDPSLSTIIVAIVGGLSGALTTGVLTLISQWITKRSEERKHFLDLCFKTAITNWERDIEIAKIKSNAGSGRIAISPLDLYIIQMMSLAKLHDLSHEKMLEEWEKIKDKTHSAYYKAKEKQVQNSIKSSQIQS